MQGYELLTPQFIVLAFGTVCMAIVFCCIRSQQSRLIMALTAVATVLAIIASMVVEFRL
jgi:hypothetical protein